MVGEHASAIVFDAVRHLYTHTDGRRVPGVTTVLKDAGASTDFDELAARSARLAHILEDKRQLGTVLHADCHAYDDEDLDWTTVEPIVRPYLEAWVLFRAHSGLRPLTRERRVFHPVHWYAGTLDGIFEAPDGRRILIDIKTGDPVHAAAHLQTAAYEAAYLVDHPGEQIDERWAVQLTPRHAVPYRATNYSARWGAWHDFDDFCSYLAAYRQLYPEWSAHV